MAAGRFPNSREAPAKKGEGSFDREQRRRAFGENVVRGGPFGADP